MCRGLHAIGPLNLHEFNHLFNLPRGNGSHAICATHRLRQLQGLDRQWVIEDKCGVKEFHVLVHEG